ncbi:MAG: glycosyltransferase family 4 protein [Clostridia bacterium]|nr:glycosyltransferase family 4 protein [Clostridia bacterium]
MEFKNKKILVIATTDDMIGNFMIPHILHMQSLGATVEVACKCATYHTDNIKNLTGCVVHDVTLTRNPFNFKTIKGYRQLKKIAKDNNYDLVNCLQPVGGVMGRLIARKYKIPCLYTAHGFHFYKGCPIQNKLIYKTIEKVLAKHTTCLVTMNQEDYESALKMKAKKVFKINGIGVDFAKYKKDPDLDVVEFRKSLGLTENDFVVASVGELNKNKNTLRLIDAMKNVKNPNVKYLICGDGVLREQYQAKIKENNLQDRCFYLGYRKDIQKILNVIDCYVMPSYREGLSKAMMEAMNYSLPIIASNIRGNKDLVGNNEGGILVNPTKTEEFTKAIEQLSNNPNQAKLYGERNATFVQNFSLEKVINQLTDIYKEI